MRNLLLFLVLPLSLLSQEDQTPDVTPQQVEQQLDTAEAQFKRAKEMFNPWYAGPLITGSAHMMPPGYMNVQPYAFVTDTYARFDANRHSQNTPDLVQLNLQLGLVQIGIAELFDTTIATLQGLFNWQSGTFGSGYGDSSMNLGLRLIKEEPFIPALKIAVGEVFPTGRYNNLNSNRNGLDATGAGMYQTQLSLRIGKLILWSTQHPMNLRATYTFSIPTRVRVKNFNAYGGGFGTQGKVRPGCQHNLSVGVEWSFTQRWVLANDFVFVHNDRTKFVGTPGTTAAGTPATVGSPSNDQFSLAPAIEYNPNPNLGFLGGVWFTVTGRNSSNFISAVLTVTYTFKVS